MVGTRRPSRVGIAQAQFSGVGLPGHSCDQRFGQRHRLLRPPEGCGGGRTAVAVLGSNLGDLYPREHRMLAENCRKGGCHHRVLQQVPHCSGNFPRRNRIIAGCARGVLVVQAGKSQVRCTPQIGPWSWASTSGRFQGRSAIRCGRATTS